MISMMKKYWHAAVRPNRYVQVGVLVLASILVAAALLWARGEDASPIETRIEAIIGDCSKRGGDHSACYEAQVPLLYPTYSVSQIFGGIREIRSLDPSYQFCHVLGHKLGERVVAEDPSKWVDAIPLNPGDGLCSNGFIHGVIGGRFRAEVLDDATIETLLPDFTRACTARTGWEPSSLDRAICYHGMGHLFDYITNADIPKALALCREITPDSYERVCVQGVFMQIYQPLEPDDYALIAQMSDKPSTTTVRAYCAKYAEDPMAQGACIEESWPMHQPHITDGTFVGTLCSWEPNAEERDMCYVSMSSIIGRLSLGKSSNVIRACSAFPREAQSICFSYSAGAVLEESRTEASGAVALCQSAPRDIAESCIDQLISHAGFVFGSNTSEYQNFCKALPADRREECASQQAVGR
jgi:hypothetical protein